MYISKKRKIIMAGIFSFVLIVGTGVGGWALSSHLEQNTKTSIQRLNLAVEAKTIPIVDSSMDSYSAKWMEQYSSDNTFEFTSQDGYDASLNYTISKKLAIENELEITVNVSLGSLSDSYTVKLPNKFSTQDISSKYVVENTIIDLPNYESDIKLISSPSIGTPITPSLIAFDSSKFQYESPSSYIYDTNGSIVKVLDVLDLYSSDNMEKFIDSYIKLSGTTLTPAELTIEFQNTIDNEETIILFEVTDGTTKSGTIITKDFSSSDLANDIESAPEIQVTLNNPNFPPTAQQIIDSSSNFYDYLELGEIPLNSKYNYHIDSVQLSNVSDELQKDIEVKIIISHKKTGISKSYQKIIGNLMSVQQNELNNMVMASNDWVKEPTISSQYIGKTIEEIISAPSSQAFIILDKNADYKYEISATKIVLGTKEVISIFVEMTNKIDNTAKISYPYTITTGFVE